MLKDIIITVLPLTTYALLISYLDFKIACLSAFVILLITGFKYLKKGFVISWISFLCLITLIAIGDQIELKYIKKDPWLITNLCFAITACLSLVVKKPFTMQYAKESVPSSKWKHPLFIKVNKILTIVWCVIFLFSFLLRLYKDAFGSILSLILLNFASIFGLLFTFVYPKYERTKARLPHAHISGE